MSELQSRADELRTLAATCKTLLDLSRATGAGNEQHELRITDAGRVALASA